MHLALQARRPRPITLGLALLVLAALLLAGWLLLRRPPTLARLLPEADAVVYADLRPVRLLTHFDAHPVPHSPDYQRFIDETGIRPERDLTQAAFALHRMPDPGGPNGVVGFSEVFRGHFDGDRLTRYLAGIAVSQEAYTGYTIFVISIAVPPVAGASAGIRPLRVAVLDDETVAASNMPTAEQMHAMLDRARSPRMVQSGPSLLAQTYAELPIGASVWGVGQLALPFSESGHVAALGLSLPVPANQPMLASLRYTTALHLRLELLAGTEGAATTQADALRGLLDVLRALSLSNTAVPVPPAMAELIRSVTVTPEHDRTLLQATIPTAVLRTLFGQTNVSAAAEPAAKPRGEPQLAAR